MAVAFLNEGATSVAAANWSDTTGFGASNVTLVINRGSQSIQTALDQSASGDVNWLDVREGFGGTIGGTGGSLIFTAAAVGTLTGTGQDVPISRFRYFASGGQCWAQVSATRALDVLQCNSGGTLNWTSGDVDRVDLDAGTLNYSSSATFGASATFYAQGGSFLIDTHATDVVPTLLVNGGSGRVRRTCTTITVTAGSLTIDLAALNITTLNIYGGRVTLLGAGTITNLNGYGGTLDCSQVQQAPTITNTLHADGFVVIPNPNVTFGTQTRIGAGGDGI